MGGSSRSVKQSMAQANSTSYLQQYTGTGKEQTTGEGWVLLTEAGAVATSDTANPTGPHCAAIRSSQTAVCKALMVTVWLSSAIANVQIGTENTGNAVLHTMNCNSSLLGLGLRRGVFTCVGWQVTLCDPIWQVTLRSCEMDFHKQLYTALLYFFTFTG